MSKGTSAFHNFVNVKSHYLMTFGHPTNISALKEGNNTGGSSSFQVCPLQFRIL